MSYSYDRREAASKKTYYAAVGNDGYVWGVGETKEKAKADALRWLEEADDVGSIDDCEYNRINEAQYETVMSGDTSWPIKEKVKSDGQKLFDYLDSKWNSVTYNPATGEGTANAGSLGTINFRESGNENAVIVSIVSKPFKTSFDEAKKAIDALSKIYQKV